MSTILHEEITSSILKLFYEVYNELGYGFLERVYQNALYLELKNKGLYVEAQKKIMVYYKGIKVGEYYADLLINNEIIIELKACETLMLEHEIQIVNYLKATKMEVGLLLNFGKTPEIKRKIYSNEFKKMNKMH